MDDSGEPLRLDLSSDSSLSSEDGAKASHDPRPHPEAAPGLPIFSSDSDLDDGNPSNGETLFFFFFFFFFYFVL